MISMHNNMTEKAKVSIVMINVVVRYIAVNKLFIVVMIRMQNARMTMINLARKMSVTVKNSNDANYAVL